MSREVLGWKFTDHSWVLLSHFKVTRAIFFAQITSDPEITHAAILYSRDNGCSRASGKLRVAEFGRSNDDDDDDDD